MYLETSVHGNSAMAYLTGATAFVYQGGPYITVHNLSYGKTGGILIDGVRWSPSDQCISVWDYDSNKATLAFGDRLGFVMECEMWIEAMNG